MVNLNEREFKAFGDTIIIRDLTIKEIVTVSELEGLEAMYTMVSYAMVKPKMTTKELESISGKFVDDLTKIVEEVTPHGSKS